MDRAQLATPPTKADYRLLNYLLAFVLVGGGLILAADIYGSESAVTQMVALIAPTVAGVVILLKGGEVKGEVTAVKQAVEAVAPQVANIDRAVNGALDARIQQGLRDELPAALAESLPPLLDEALARWTAPSPGER